MRAAPLATNGLGFPPTGVTRAASTQTRGRGLDLREAAVEGGALRNTRARPAAAPDQMRVRNRPVRLQGRLACRRNILRHPVV